MGAGPPDRGGPNRRGSSSSGRSSGGQRARRPGARGTGPREGPHRHVASIATSTCACTAASMCSGRRSMSSSVTILVLDVDRHVGPATSSAGRPGGARAAMAAITMAAERASAGDGGGAAAPATLRVRQRPRSSARGRADEGEGARFTAATIEAVSCGAAAHADPGGALGAAEALGHLGVGEVGRPAGSPRVRRASLRSSIAASSCGGAGVGVGPRPPPLDLVGGDERRDDAEPPSVAPRSTSPVAAG